MSSVTCEPECKACVSVMCRDICNLQFSFVARKRKPGHHCLGLCLGPHLGLLLVRKNGGNRQPRSQLVVANGDSEWSCIFVL